MIYYRPTDGDPHTAPLPCRPRTCFLMTQLGEPVPSEVGEIRKALGGILTSRGYDTVDAESVVTGRDFLLKIWDLIVSVPVGIAILHQDMRANTVANIFYELGLMQAYGKETLVIKTRDARVPSDFVRTEYIEYGSGFENRLRKFLDSLDDRAEYYTLVSDQVENNPLLAIDFLRRAYLLTRSADVKRRAREIFDSAGLASRAKSSVEMLLVNSFE